MENTELNKLIDETLRSLDGMKPAEPNPFLFSKIRQRINDSSKSGSVKKISLKPAWGLAIVFIILFIINVVTIINYSNNTTQQTTISSTTNINSFIEDYSLSNSTYNY